MDGRGLGTGGPELSVLGLGCNNFGMKIDAAQTAAVVGAALDAGVTHFDTAEMYGGGKSEEYLGAALGARRDEAVVATKFLPRPKDEPYRPGALAARLVEGAEGSLRRLGTDRLDVLYQHYPDPEAPLDELLEAFESLTSSGKVLAVALSNVDATQIAAAAEAARGLPLRGVQIEWSLLSRAVEESVVPAAREAGLGVVPYFPLASGLLTGKYNGPGGFPEGSRLAVMPRFAASATPEKLAAVDRLTELARDHGHPVADLAFAWLLAQDEVTSVIAGATTPEQVAANAASVEWVLDPVVVDEVEKVLAG